MVRWILTLCIVAGFGALTLDPAKAARVRAAPLRSETGEPVPWPEDAFRANAVYSSTPMDDLPAGLAFRGSWLGSDDATGSTSTGWYRAIPRVSLFVAGYPTRLGNRLEIEARLASGERRRIAFASENPKETWQTWTVRLPPDAQAFCIHASDNTTGVGGWLGFSEPFRADNRLAVALQTAAQLVLVFALAIALLFAPGYAWWRVSAARGGDVAKIIALGPLLLIAAGALCWLAGGIVPVAFVARASVAVILAASGIALWRRSAPRSAPTLERVLLASWCIAGFAVAKANFSTGPSGELYGGTISRSLAAGDRSDSRISYHVVQVIAQHLSPHSTAATAYFSPWNFGARGPLAGMLAAPIVLATGGTVPAEMPDQAWRPFDRQGFAAYRIGLIVLASLAGLALFAVVESLVGVEWAAWAATGALLSPFYVHELFFTWPKLAAAAGVLLSFLALRCRRPALAGISLAIGYLFHPLAALSGPFLATYLAFGSVTGGQRMSSLVKFFAGSALFVVPWQLAVARGGQSVFLSYWLSADAQPATWSTWWQSRWDNFANTFLPFHLLRHTDHGSINSIFGPSDAWVHIEFLYWNTLPFALGIGSFVFIYYLLGVALRRATAVSVLLWFAPAALLIAYWGSVTTGLMREGGHVLFLSLFVLCAWVAAREGGRTRAIALALTHPLFLAGRALEVGFMAFGATLHARVPHFGETYYWNDLLSLATALCFLALTVILLASLPRPATTSDSENLALASSCPKLSSSPVLPG